MKKLNVGIVAVVLLVGGICVWKVAVRREATSTTGSETAFASGDGDRIQRADDPGGSKDVASLSASLSHEGGTASSVGADGKIESAASPATADLDKLAIERNLLRGKSLDGMSARTYLQSNRFDALMREFHAESSRDPLSSELTSTYSNAMAQQIGASGNSVKINDFSCGLNLCMGSINSKDQASYDQWQTQFSTNKGSPSYAYADYTVDMGGGVVQHRFMFSTDPKSNSVTFPAAHP